MSPPAETREGPAPRLSLPGQTYVAAVGLAATATVAMDAEWAWWVLVVLALPFSLVAMWVGFYAALTVGFVLGHGPESMSVAAGITWVAVWTATAWVNARLAEKLRRRGWDALRVNPRRDPDPDDW